MASATLIGLLIGVALFIVTLFVFAIAYIRTGFAKRFYHDVLGWHEPADGSRHFPYMNLSPHATCRHCGREIIQDSQGNWFTIGGAR